MAFFLACDLPVRWLVHRAAEGSNVCLVGITIAFFVLPCTARIMFVLSRLPRDEIADILPDLVNRFSRKERNPSECTDAGVTWSSHTLEQQQAISRRISDVSER